MAEEATLKERAGDGAEIGQQGFTSKSSDSKEPPANQEQASSKTHNSSPVAASDSNSKHQNITDGENTSHSRDVSHLSSLELFCQNNYLINAGCFVSPMPPYLYPPPLCGLVPVPFHDQPLQHGGLYAAPFFPYVGPIPFASLGGPVPLPYNAPLGVAAHPEQWAPIIIGQAPNIAPVERAVVQEASNFGAQEGLHQRHAAVPPMAQAQAHTQGAQAQEAEPQRQVVRRFRVGFQVDLLLILKLAVVVFFFNQNGYNRLLLLLSLAVVIYMYQTGALAPILRWISTRAQHFMRPTPQAVQRVPDAQAQQGLERGGGGDNIVANERNAAALGAAEGLRDEHGNVPPAEGAAVGQGAAIPPATDQNPARGPRLWAFLKEIQILLVGFVTSLLPGFQTPE